MSRIGKGEPTYSGELFKRYLQRFTVVTSLDPWPAKEIRINGVELDREDSAYVYVRKAGKSIRRCSLNMVDTLLVRFHLTLSDFELWYREQGGVIHNDFLAGD